MVETEAIAYHKLKKNLCAIYRSPAKLEIEIEMKPSYLRC